MIVRFILLALAGIALWRLWDGAHPILWWAVLILLILDWWTTATVRTAARSHAKELGLQDVPLHLIPSDDVQRFWVKVNMVIAALLLLLSVTGIVLPWLA